MEELFRLKLQKHKWKKLYHVKLFRRPSRIKIQETNKKTRKAYKHTKNCCNKAEKRQNFNVGTGTHQSQVLKIHVAVYMGIE